MRIKYWALEFIDPTLRKLVNDFEKWWIEQTGEEPTITSIYRIGDSGVHGQLPVRGMDFECQDDELGYDCGGTTILFVRRRWSAFTTTSVKVNISTYRYTPELSPMMRIRDEISARCGWLGVCVRIHAQPILHLIE